MGQTFINEFTLFGKLIKSKGLVLFGEYTLSRS